MKYFFLTLTTLLVYSAVHAQNSDSSRNRLDSIYLDEVEERRNPAKILHAEPLYIDLIRDLGARKGEREWNVGLGITDKKTFDAYTALVEYEWAPFDRFGLEVELPFTLYSPVNSGEYSPGSRLNSLKFGSQYTFYVSEKSKTSLALGYIHEFEMSSFKSYKKNQIFSGNLYNPFFVAAKRWGQNFHTLLYTGPQFSHHFSDNLVSTRWQINTNFHYMIDGTRNFVGIEFNKELSKGDFDMTIRPQMRVGVTENLLIGIVTGIPINRENERFSTFLRLIYEPRHHKIPG